MFLTIETVLASSGDLTLICPLWYRIKTFSLVLLCTTISLTFKRSSPQSSFVSRVLAGPLVDLLLSLDSKRDFSKKASVVYSFRSPQDCPGFLAFFKRRFLQNFLTLFFEQSFVRVKKQTREDKAWIGFLFLPTLPSVAHQLKMNTAGAYFLFYMHKLGKLCQIYSWRMSLLNQHVCTVLRVLHQWNLSALMLETDIQLRLND